jgi:hypothetical protein
VMLRETSAMKCCAGFFMGIVSPIEEPAHPIFRQVRFTVQPTGVGQ